jgi:hypothetical protein
LHSEVNLLIQHIIVQYQDGQNNTVLVLESEWYSSLYACLDARN